ncbi:MAG: class 1 fructose-bisphosphatase [Phycisphaerae bacterium]|nr:class 1 fructose-bisphosphatase [Phycisphaerae bacterium]
MSSTDAGTTGAESPSNRGSRNVVTDNLVSLQGFILEEEARYPGASGEFSWIISAISLAAKIIAHKVRHVRLQGVLGDHGETNVQGAAQLRKDVIANEVIMRVLGGRNSIAVLGSEEDENPTILRRGNEGGTYCVLFDPLDGSSNLDTAVGVGTIFTVLRNDPDIPGAIETVCQPGTKQVAAGYVLYGSSTVFVVTTGNGVHMFELDGAIGSFMLVKRDLQMPPTRKIYSVNEAYYDGFPVGYQRYLEWAHKNGYSARYIGSMVADMHRTLINGGVFLYPPTKKHPTGKLRLLYEANPMSFLVEQAGGTSLTGTRRTLEVVPTQLHERTPLVLGSRDEVARVVEHFRTPADALP